MIVSRSGRAAGGAARSLTVLFVAFMLRAVLLGIPPVLEQMRKSLGISHVLAGLVVGLPVLMLGVSALPGAALARRVGSGRTVSLGLMLLTAGALLRAAPGGLTPVMGGTLLLAVGIGAAQPPLARMVQVWFPRHVQRAATVMTVGLLGGGIAGAALTPLAVRGIAHDWRGSFVFWGVLASVAAAAWLIALEQSPGAPVAEAPVALLPLLTDPRVRWVTLLFAAQAAIFYTSNTWTAAASSGGAEGSAANLNLFCLNLAALPVALALALTGRPFSSSSGFYLVSAAMCVAGAVGWIVAGPELGIVWSLLLGGGSAAVLVGTIAYTPMTFPPSQVAAVAATVWTTGYLAAFVGPPAAGLGIDLLNYSRAPFILCLACSLLLVLGARGRPPSGAAVARQ